ncbi:endosomal cargo receptor [Grosmannia clavigera kw1407]|uniref:Endosomal cargo receptor n=1 Tax=Grosmannia clavigera (strain kw1407 / UAMH 11150) TaxID=655863 RepID=F0XSJ8_GROCL|nr:endosomal cargo receptor [Grosmannia clavigera kw1407]EFW99068.1 endosomal cargo receptor [Grosmannia clavigera kw1407]
MKAILPLLTLASAASALHLYIDNTKPKCFFEELPKDTLVVGHYNTAEFDDRTNSWQQHDGISTYISVDETFDNDHRVVSQRGAANGRFTFTAAEAGEHKICFTPNSNSGRNGGVKLNLDLAIGESSKLESTDKGKLEDLEGRLRDLNSRLNGIRREQVFQREREADFRDQSEATNARVIRWIVIQLVVLGVTCTWQLSHLRSFFIKQKLT